MPSLIGDLKMACRSWWARPLLLIVAVVSLALGIGVNAAISSLFEQVLLRPLPVPEPQRLVNLSAPGPKFGWTSTGSAGESVDVFSYPMFRDLADSDVAADVFSGIAAHRDIAVVIQASGADAATAVGQTVSENYFEVLQLRPALGRLLASSDRDAIGSPRIAVLGHGLWRSQFAADPNIVGRSIVVNGQTLEIVGVAPDGFTGTVRGSPAQLFVPISLRWLLQPSPEDRPERRDAYWAYLFARLAPNVDQAMAAERMAPLYRRITQEVDLPLQTGISEEQRRSFSERALVFSDGRRGQSAGANNARSALYMLWGVSTLVLLIACLNVSNLLLARGAERVAELALRASLGATRWRLMRQVLTEALVIGLLGAVVSLPIAALVISTLGDRLSTVALGGIGVELNLVMALFALAIGLASVVIVGLFPGISLARAALMTSLRAGNGHTGGVLAQRFRHALAIAQIALSTAALVIAGLFAQSLYNIHRADAGIAIESLSTFSVSPERIGLDGIRSKALFEDVQKKLAAVPGVTSVSSSMVRLLTGDRWGWGIEIAGRTQEPGQNYTAYYSRVGEEFFATLQTPMLLGREFGPEDHEGSEAVAVVNRAFVEKFSLGDNPVGQAFRLGGSGGGDVRIVGVVGDLAYEDVRNTGRPLFFTPWRQSEWLPVMNFYVRSSLPAEQVHSAIRGLMQDISPGLPVDDLQAVRESVALNVATERLIGVLTTGFSVLATLLAAVGLYGVINYALTQRTCEFGLRLALGAQPKALKQLLFVQVSRMLLIGCGLGILIALIGGGAAEAMLFGLTGRDPKVTLLAVLVIVAVGLAATALPARRVTRIAPLEVMR